MARQPLLKPVLFLIFNRPKSTQIVFDEIKKAKPRKLYIAADGPRKKIFEDKERCLLARDIIKQIDWDCKVYKLFRDNNLGCKVAVSSALNWFFKNEECGIILEDDCVPEQSFFWFCQELLKKYKNDKRVMMISGMNYLFNKVEIKESYFFTNYYAIWGWATWKRAWNLCDMKMTGWNEFKRSNQLNWFYGDGKMADFIQTMIQDVYNNKVDSWGLYWFYTCVTQNGLSIVPKFNLISNIGVSGIHAGGKANLFNFMPTKHLNTHKMVHPRFFIPDMKYNKIMYDNIIKVVSIKKVKIIKNNVGKIKLKVENVIFKILTKVGLKEIIKKILLRFRKRHDL